MPVSQLIPGGLLRQVAGTVAVGVLSAGAWAGWLGGDHTYQLDLDTGGRGALYEWWQVAGCALTLLVVLVVALLGKVRPVPASVALIVAFTTAWTVHAVADPDSAEHAVLGAVTLLLALSTMAIVTSMTVIHTHGWFVLRRMTRRPGTGPALSRDTSGSSSHPGPAA